MTSEVTDMLTAAADALLQAEDQNARTLELTRDGVARYTIRDRSRPPAQNILWEGDDFSAATLELKVIKDARRITAVSHVILKYERERVWKLAIQAAQNAYVPEDEKDIPADAAEVLRTSTPAQAALRGARLQKALSIRALVAAADADADT